MNKLVSLSVFLVIALSGCANVGPQQLSACLNDHEVMDTYKRIKHGGNFATFDGISYLTGGINKTGKVTCYWQTHSLVSDIFVPLSNPHSRCINDGNERCAILMQGEKVVFEPGSPYVVSAASSGATYQHNVLRADDQESVVWKFVGVLAEGMVYGLAEYYTQKALIPNRPSQIYQEKEQHQSAPQSNLNSNRPLTCSRDLIPGPAGAKFTCSRW